MRHDSFVGDTTPFNGRRTFTQSSVDSFVWDMAPSYRTWLIRIRCGFFIWDMTHSYGTWRYSTHFPDDFSWRAYEYVCVRTCACVCVEVCGHGCGYGCACCLKPCLSMSVSVSVSVSVPVPVSVGFDRNRTGFDWNRTGFDMKESCQIWRQYPRYRQVDEWVMSDTNKSCLIPMSHVTCDISNESCHIWHLVSHGSGCMDMQMSESYLIEKSHVLYEWVMSHTNESSHISNESCHIWHLVSHGSRYMDMQMDDSYLTRANHVWFAGVMSHMTLVPGESWDRVHGNSLMFHTNETCPLYGVALMSRIDTIIGLFCKRAL